MPDLAAVVPVVSGPDLGVIRDIQEADIWIRWPLAPSPDLVLYGQATYAPEPTNIAQLFAALDSASAAATAIAAAQATLGASLDDASLSAAGAAAVQASFAAALDGATLASAGVSPVQATLGATLSDAALSGAAVAAAQATATATLDDATAAAAAIAPAKAALGAPLDDVVGAATALAPAQATLGRTLDDATLSAVGGGVVVSTATLSATLSDASLAADAIALVAPRPVTVTPRVKVSVHVDPQVRVAVEVTPVAKVGCEVTPYGDSMSDEYDVGDDATITCPFRLDRAETNPTAVFADVYPPRGNMFTVTYPTAAFTRPRTGIYQLKVDCTMAGRWRVVFRSTGTAKGAGQVAFVVKETPAP